MKFLSVFIVICLIIPVFAQDSNGDKSQIEGAWFGHDANRIKQKCLLYVSGNKIVFKGSYPQDWYVGELKFYPSNPNYVDITIADTAIKRFKGMTSLCIYKVDGNSATVVAGMPGDSNRPTSFNRGRRVRIFHLKKQ